MALKQLTLEDLQATTWTNDIELEVSREGRSSKTSMKGSWFRPLTKKEVDKIREVGDINNDLVTKTRGPRNSLFVLGEYKKELVFCYNFIVTSCDLAFVKCNIKEGWGVYLELEEGKKEPEVKRYEGPLTLNILNWDGKVIESISTEKEK